MIRVLPILAVVCAIAVFVFFPKWTVDDAFITYRYAANLATHGQLTWNVGEKPIEGYTGIALPVMLAGFLQLGIQPEVASHAIGIASFFLTGAFLLLTLRKLKLGNLAIGVMALIYATLPFLYTNALSGLETMLFLASMTASLYLFLCCVEISKRQPRYEQLLMGLLFLTSLIRPEGVAWSVVLIAAIAYTKFTMQREDLWPFAWRALIYAIPAAAYFAWRIQYYGQLFPTTFYAKTSDGFSLDNLKGLNAFLFVFFSAPFAAAAITLSIDTDTTWKHISEGRLLGNAKRLKIALSAMVAFIAIVVTQQSRARLSMNFSYRFFVPFIPILLALFGVALDLGLQRLRETRASNPLRYRFVITLLIALAVYHFAQVAHRFKDEIRFASEYQTGLEQMHIPVGAFLKKQIPKPEWLMALYDAGAIPYFSDLKTVDMGGLNDTLIAQKKISTPQERINYFFSKRPGAAVFSSHDATRVLHDPVAEAIVADPRFQDYRLAKTYVSPPESWKDFFLLVYLRKDLLISR